MPNDKKLNNKQGELKKQRVCHNCNTILSPDDIIEMTETHAIYRCSYFACDSRINYYNYDDTPYFAPDTVQKGLTIPLDDDTELYIEKLKSKQPDVEMVFLSFFVRGQGRKLMLEYYDRDEAIREFVKVVQFLTDPY